MTNIENVNYQTLANNAKVIREDAVLFNAKATSVYNKIKEMHSVWYGTQFEELVKKFQNIIPQLNNILDLVVGDIPYSLEMVANNYSQSDKGINITSAEKTMPIKIEDFPQYTEGQNNLMRCISGEVENYQTQITTNLDEIMAKMDDIQRTFASTPWESDASEKYSATLTNLKNEIVESFDNIKSQFTNLMNQTLSAIQAAETGNTL